MSSALRNIQRTVKRAADPDCCAPHFMGRGSKLGVRNPNDKALLARLKREKRNAERRAAQAKA